MFSTEKILNFEQLDTLADIYAVESSLFANEESRVADYVSDIAQVKINLAWRAMVQGWTESWA